MAPFTIMLVLSCLHSLAHWTCAERQLRTVHHRVVERRLQSSTIHPGWTDAPPSVYSPTPNPFWTPSSIWKNTKAPLPTNKWFGPLGFDDPANAAWVSLLPFNAKANANSLGVSFSQVQSFNNHEAEVVTEHITIGSAEGGLTRSLDRYDEITATVSWRTSGSSTGPTHTDVSSAYYCMSGISLTGPNLGGVTNPVPVSGALSACLQACSAQSGCQAAVLDASGACVMKSNPWNGATTASDTAPPNVRSCIKANRGASDTDGGVTGAGSFQFFLARGGPFITGQYSGLTPNLIIRSAGITSPAQGLVAATQKLRVQLNNGQTWLLYSSTPVTWKVAMSINPSNGAAVWAISAQSPFTGVLRVACLTADTAGGLEGVLDGNWGVYATSADVTFQPDGSSYTFNFQTASIPGAPGGELLAAALPHHTASGLSLPVVLPAAYLTIRGRLPLVRGSSWQINVAALPDGLSWSAPRGPAAQYRSTIKDALVLDVKNFQVTADDPYFGTSQLAALGRLAVIADELGDSASATAARNKMRPYLQSWLQGSNADRLRYDSTWGGLIPQRSLADKNAAFGSVGYNDHHFHYGYLLYAVAAMARGDASFLADPNMKAAALCLVRDYANPSASDPYFPFARVMDVFESHSWANGLFLFSDSKNQESSSEAVNSYYAVFMLGLALGDSQLATWGRLLMSMEVLGAKTYWQIKPGGQIYTPPFSNKYVVGVLWSTKADYATWFGLNPEYIFGIQFLPPTPAMEALVDPDWLRQAWPTIQAGAFRPDLAPGWRAFLDCARSTFDLNAAWSDLVTLPAAQYAGGWAAITRTAALYFIATRPGAGGGSGGGDDGGCN